MAEHFEVQETILAWINGRLEAADHSVHLNSIKLAQDGTCHVTATVKKLGISADVELRCRLDGKDRKLLIHDVDISTSNLIARNILPQLKGVIIAKGQEALAPLAIEIVE